MNKIENTYMKEVKKFLPLRTNNRKKILSAIKMGLEEYILDYEIDNYPDLISGFGTPQDIVDSYIMKSPSDMRIKNYKAILTIIIINVLLICGITFCISSYYYNRSPAYIIEEAPVNLDFLPMIKE